MAVLQYLVEHRTHPTADEIYSGLVLSIPTLSKTTVYNTLKLLVENGAALMLTIDDRSVCFDGDISLHTHFLCKCCGKVYDLPYRGAEEVPVECEIEGHRIEEMQIYYKGICKECINKKC